VAWDAGILDTGPGTFHGEGVTVADTTGLHFDADVSCAGFRDLALDDLEIGLGLGNLRYLHGSYCD
jgi:hypothetical protein